MKKRFVHWLALGALALSQAFMASPANAACVNNVCDTKVKRIYYNNAGDIWVDLLDSAGVTCDLISGYYIEMDQSAPNWEEIYAVVLTAHERQRNLHVRLSSSGTCKFVWVSSIIL